MSRSVAGVIIVALITDFSPFLRHNKNIDDIIQDIGTGDITDEFEC